jgi:hypothetical protein
VPGPLDVRMWAVAAEVPGSRLRWPGGWGHAVTRQPQRPLQPQDWERPCVFVTRRERRTHAWRTLAQCLRTSAWRGEVSPLGRWARLQGEQGTVYVAEAAFGSGYYSWCDTPQQRTAQPYLDPAEAIQAALHRAEREVPVEEAAVDERITEPVECVAQPAWSPMASPRR